MAKRSSRPTRIELQLLVFSRTLGVRLSPLVHQKQEVVSVKSESSHSKSLMRFPIALPCVLLLITSSVGCSKGPQIVPVKGKVLYNGEPLTFGSVMFQPEAGQPARASIQGDGTFVLTTDSVNDGAKVGRNRIRVTCYESQNATEGEATLGKLLIPRKYTDIDTSGIVIEVPAGGADDIVIELTDDE